MNTVITISRQYGSCGRAIGKILADQLDVPFYDKAELKKVTLESGLGDSMEEALGWQHAGSLLYSLATSAYSFGYYDASRDSPISQKAYLVAFEAVKKVARKGPCVIVGRCADYVLEGVADRISIFIHAPMARRVETVVQRLHVGREEAEAKIREIDRLRRNYYNYYTTKDWGDVDSYHLSVDSSVFGTDSTASLLKKFVVSVERIPVSSQGNHSALL